MFIFQELYVHHFDYKSDKEHNAAIQVLACDTITQTKSKILDVLYNNIPYSQRPLVHGTLLGKNTKCFITDVMKH